MGILSRHHYRLRLHVPVPAAGPPSLCLKLYLPGLFVFLCLLLSMALYSPSARAGAADDTTLGAGKVGSFAIDVLQDFAFEGMTAEDSGKARLNAFVKDKIKGGAKNLITGGDDLSEGMGLILNRIYDSVNNAKRNKGGTAGTCQAAALNQARAIAFDAKNLRLLRGFGNIWFDAITAIPGAPALAEKLVTDVGKAGYEKLRSKMEELIKQHYTEDKNETFKYSRTSGNCTLSMTVIWNKKKGKYLFIIKGDCQCKEVNAAGALEKARNIRMKGFEVIGGGNVALKLNVKNPQKPELKISVLPAQHQLSANCACDTTVIEEPPPPPEESPVTLSLQEGIFFTDKLRCQACESLHTALGRIADKTRELAAGVNEVANRVNQEKFDTAERRKDIALYHQRLDEFENAYDLFDRRYVDYVACEEKECRQLGAISLPLLDTLGNKTTSCDACKKITADLNRLIDSFNDHVGDMNGLALLANKHNHGTVEGNKLFRSWNTKEQQLKTLKAQVDAGLQAKRSCEAQNCFAREGFEKTSISGGCPACSSIVQRLNKEERAYNDMVEEINKRDARFREFVINGGDPATKEGNRLSHASIELFAEFNAIADRMYALRAELIKCDPDKCDAPVEEGGGISIGREPIKLDEDKRETGGDSPDKQESSTTGSAGDTGKKDQISGGGAKTREPQTRSGAGGAQPASKTTTGAGGAGKTVDADSVIDDLGQPLRKISTRCTPCQSIVRQYNSTIDRIQQLQTDLEKAIEEQTRLENLLHDLAQDMEAFEFPQTEPYETPDGRKTTRLVVTWPPSSVRAGNFYTVGKSFFYNKRDVDRARRYMENEIKQAQENLVKAAAKTRDIRFQRDVAYKSLTAITIALVKCERQCAVVKILNVINLIGNNPLDREDPLKDGNTGNDIGSELSEPAVSVPTIQVVNNIPINRLFLAGPEPVSGPSGCAENHFHGTANNCNGISTPDPNPSGCGHGTVSQVISIPVTSCPDL